jgi:HEAT repeat protein
MSGNVIAGVVNFHHEHRVLAMIRVVPSDLIMLFSSLTPEAQELLRQIWSPPAVFDRLLGKADHRIPLIEQVGAGGEIAALLSILPLMLNKSAEVAQAASDCVHRLVSTVPPEQFPTLDEDVRKSSDYWYGPDSWCRLNPKQVATLPKTEITQASVMGVVSFHHNGHVREAAIRQLDRIENGSELPYLLLRLNDWVANVRAAAKSAVQRRLVPSRRTHFIKNIYLVVRLSDCERDDHGKIVRWVFEGIVSSGDRDALFGLLQNESKLVRRKSFELGVEIPGEHLEPFTLAGLHANDVVLRLRAAQRVRQVFGGESLLTALPVMEQDRFMPVRREALLTRLEKQPEMATTYLEQALLDRSASLRELARFYLAKMGRTNFAGTYRSALQEGNTAVALAGLGETGTKDDLALVMPFVRSPMVKERIPAIRAVAKLGGEDVVEDLLTVLPDDSAKVTQAAKKGIEGHLHKFDAERLWAILTHDARPHVRFAILDLLNQFGSWAGLPYMIKLAADSDETLAFRARELILGRFNHVFTKPSATVQEQIVQAMNEVGESLDSRFCAQLEAWLKTRLT